MCVWKESEKVVTKSEGNEREKKWQAGMVRNGGVKRESVCVYVCICMYVCVCVGIGVE